MAHHHSNLSRRGMLSTLGALGAAIAARPALGATGGARVPKNIIWFFANGGWDVTFCMDPKLGVGFIEGPEVDENPNIPTDRNAVSTIHGLPIVTNEHARPAVTRFFETYGQDTLVLNGIWTGSIVHEGCRMRILTGNSTASVPDLPTQIGARNGVGMPLGSVDMSGLGYAGSLAASTGRVGVRSQLKALIDPASVFQPDPAAGYGLPLQSPSVGSRAAIDDYLRSRAAQLQGAGWTDGAVNDQRVADLLQSMDRRRMLLDQGNTLVEDLTISEEPTLATQAGTAVDLIATGMCRSVLVSDPSSWDTHDINSLQHDRYEDFFNILGQMMAQLTAADLLEDTLVVVASEMTRTPRRNSKTGKDHWAHTSMLMLGGGVTGGRSIGATDDALESLPVDLDTGEAIYDREASPDAPLLKYDNLAAGILELFDIDPGEVYPTIPPLRALTA